MRIFHIPAYTDNYIWVMQSGSDISVIDPGDALPVLEHIKKNDLNLVDILLTHHHFDHVGGTLQLKKQISGKVYGPFGDIEGVDVHVTEKDKVETLDYEFSVLETPGHTLDHIAFVDKQKKLVFCGDTLFSAGCGRVFEGTFEQMHNSIQKLNRLDPETVIYCAHEYTESNLEFALEVDASNHDLKKRVADLSKKMTANNGCSIPSNLALELKTNPFLRCDLLRDSLKDCKTEMDAFSYLRSWKDNF